MRRGVAIVGMAIVVLVGAASTASAHAAFESSDPSSGEILTTAPSSVTMSFTEPPDLDLSEVTVLDARGGTVEVGPLQRAAAPRSMTFSLPRLDDGVYTVSWRVVSTVDGHPTTNVFAFGVGADPAEATLPPGAEGGGTPSPSPLAVGGKVLLYVGLVLGVGIAVVSTFALRTVPGRRWLVPIAGTASFVGALAMTFAEARSIEVSIADLLRSETGRSYVWLLGTVALTFVFSLAASRMTRPLPLLLMGAAAIAAMAVRATSGHAAAITPAWPAELAQLVHLVGVGVWIGGLAALLVLLVERRGDGPALALEAAAFSRLAGWAVLAVLGTGIARSIGEAGGVEGVRSMLADTTYGTVLLIKVAIALALIGLGALNRRRSIPRLTADEGGLLRRVIAIELAGALGVFALTGTLTSLNPDPPMDRPDPRPAAVSASGADFATTTRVTLTATPGSAGPNTFEAEVVDYDERSPLAADEVSLRLEAIGRPEIEPATLELAPAGAAADGAPASWRGTGTQLSLAGAWDVVITVRTGARTTQVPLVLVTRAPPTTSVVAQGGEGPAIETFDLPTGEQLQLYLDPSVAGANEFHVTAFDAQGEELPLSGLVVVAVGPDGHGEAVEPTRLTPGHFAVPVEVTEGRWRFEAVATTEGGTVLQAVQHQEITA